MFIKGFGIGVLLGAALGILFAPNSGEETRGKIKDFASDTSDKIAKKINALKNKAADKFDDYEMMGDFKKMGLDDEQKKEIKEIFDDSFNRIKKIIS